jgi:alpha-L-fucosidase
MLFVPLNGFGQYQYPEDPEVLENLREWQDLKFGLFMHCGAYSQCGAVESWTICPTDYDRIKRPKEGTYSLYVQDYENLIYTFNPVGFNPDRRSAAARDAGMRYVIFTARHHDGFNMFDTRQSDCKITSKNCPFSKQN